VSAPDQRLKPPTQEQVNARRLQALHTFFACYNAEPRPDAVVTALNVVRDQSLMRAPDMRYGIAGAIIGLLTRHPQESEGWTTAHPAIIQEAGSLIPDDDDLKVTRVGEIDFLFMNWLVGGDPAGIDRIIALAQRSDTVGQAALACVVAHAQLPGVVEALNERAPVDARVQLLSIPEAQTCQKSAVALAERLGQDEQGSLHVLYVGYAPVLVPVDGKKVWDHRLVVCTPSGQAFVGLPQRWDGMPVDVRQATPDEMAQRQHILSQLKDTV